MSTVNISKAAKLVGISRAYFYRKYINTGIISVSKDGGKSFVDTSELMRVFNSLHGEQIKVTEVDGRVITPNTSEMILLEKIKGLDALLEAKEKELEGYREREKHLYHLLEYRPKKRRWFGLKL